MVYPCQRSKWLYVVFYSLIPFFLFSNEYRTFEYSLNEGMHSSTLSELIEKNAATIYLNSKDASLNSKALDEKAEKVNSPKLMNLGSFGLSSAMFSYVSTTPFNSGVTFGGDKEFLIPNTNEIENNPLMRFKPDPALGVAVSGSTISNGQPWATSVVFDHSASSGNVTLWSQTYSQTAFHQYGKVALSIDNNRLKFYYGDEVANLTWNSNTNFIDGVRYNVFIDYDGGSTRGSDPIPFRIRIVDSFGNVTTPAGTWSVFNGGYPTNGTCITSRCGSSERIYGYFYVGANYLTSRVTEDAVDVFNSKIYSIVLTTLTTNTTLPTDAEITMITLDPLKWLVDYKEGKPWRKPNENASTSNFILNSSDAADGAQGTKVWLMGDGLFDSATNIENQVAYGISSQDLSTDTVLPPFEGVPPKLTDPGVLSVNENITGSFYTVKANVSGVKYFLGPGDDNRFILNQTTGELSFKNIPDYENPVDVGNNNEYEVKIIARDSFGVEVELQLKIVVLNINELDIEFDNIGKTYGDADFNLSATSNSGGLITYKILVGSSLVDGYFDTNLSGLNNSSVSIGDAGTITIRALVDQNGGIDAGFKDVILTIAKKEITITPNSGQTKVYGVADPLDYLFTTSTDLKSGDNFFGGLTRVSGDAVGNYEISKGDLRTTNDANYNLIYTSGIHFTITPKEISVTPRIGQTKVFGSLDPILIYDVVPALESGDVFTGSLNRETGDDIGSYEITQSDLTAGSNYILSFTTGVDFSITPKDISITPVSGQTKVYGDSEPVLTYTVFPGLNTGDFFTGDLVRVSGENSGDYAIGLGDLSAGPNYNLVFDSGIDFTVLPVEILVTPLPGQTKVYKENDPVILNYSVFPDLNMGDSFTGGLSRVSGEIVGNYNITLGDLNAGSNYNLVLAAGNDFKITPKTVTVTPTTGQSKVYGESEPVFEYTISSELEFGDVFTGSLSRAPGDDIGNYEITQNDLTAGSNYNLIFTSGVDFMITPKVISVTPVLDQSKIYGETDPVLIYNASPSLNIGDSFSGSLTRVSGNNAGNYAIGQGDLSAGSNYAILFNSGINFTIVPKDIMVTPITGQSKIYGDTDPNFAYSLLPTLEIGDVFSGQLSRVSGENIGEYEITQGSFSAGTNYNLLFVTGKNFKIDTKAISIKPDTSQSKVYGSADPIISFTTIPSLVGGDVFTGNLTRIPGENIGSYAINQGSLTAGSNYTLVFDPNIDFRINSKEISITPLVGQSKVFGTVDPILKYSVAPFLELGDVLSGDLSRVSGENIGFYAISQGTLDAGSNYTLVFNEGVDFRVAPKEIRVTPLSGQSKVYGQTDPILSYRHTPDLEPGDNFTGNLVRVLGENIGEFEISQGSLNAGSNYSLVFESGVEFTIIPKNITVTPVAGQSKIYGDLDPSILFNVSSALEFGDVFSGSLGRTVGEDVGSYAITNGDLTAGPNYNLIYNSGVDFNILPKDIFITSSSGQAKIYGEVDPELTYDIIPGLLSGDSFTGGLSRVSGEIVGNYSVTLGDLSAGSNYNLVLAAGNDFKITPKTVTVTPTTGQSKVYGESEPVFEYTISSKLEFSDVFTGSLSRAPGNDIGNYEITLNDFTAGSNYNLIFTSGVDFKITPKVISVTPVLDQSKIYGETDPVLIYNASPSLNIGDSFSGSLSRVSGNTAGNYAIGQGDLSAGSNYTILFNSSINFTIVPKDIMVTPITGQSKIYGDTDPNFAYSLLPTLEIGDVFSGQLSRVSGENIGEYEITQGSFSAGTNYNLLFVTGKNFKIDTKAISIKPDTNQSKVYGSADPIISFTTIPSLVGGDVFTGNLTRIPGENIGAYAINQGSLSAGSNYTLVFDPNIDFRINSKEISITPLVGQSKVFGTVDPILKYSVAPSLELGDVLSGDLSRVSGENIGFYTISQGTLNAGANYTLVFNEGVDFRVAPKEIRVTPLSSQSKVYGQTDPILSYRHTPDLEPGDNFTGSLVRVLGENIGEFEIRQGSLNAGSNYSLVFESGIDFTIIPKNITVTPVAGQSKIYGDLDPSILFNVSSSLEFGDVFSGSLGRTVGEDIGSYAITNGDLTAGSNYNLIYNSGVDFNILPKKILITPTSGQSKEYGQSDPVFEYTIFPNTVDSSEINGNLSRVSGENIGAYELLLGSLSASKNYEIEMTAGVNFNIQLRNPNLEINDIVKTYGDADFILDATSDSNGMITYSILGDGSGTTLSGARNEIVSIGNAGNVIIRVSITATTNYSESYKDIQLTIDKAVLSAKAENVSRVYLSDNPDFTIIYDGFVNGDTVADIDEEPTAKTIATFDSNVGEYYIVLYGGMDNNYTIESGLFSLGVLTIVQRIPSIAFSNISKTYGDPDFNLEATTNSVGEISYSFVGDAIGNILSGVGNDIFSIVNAGLVRVRATVEGTTNYATVYKDITVTVDKKDLIARANDISRPYGEENPEFTIDYEGFVYEDSESDLDEIPLAISITDTYSNVGEYFILLFGGSDNNYNIITSLLNPGVLTVLPQTPIIDFENITKTYGDPDFDLSALTDSDISIKYTITGEENGTTLYGANNQKVAIGNAGAVKIKATYGATANYEGVSQEIILIIEKSKIGIDLIEVSKEYGQLDPEFEYTITSGNVREGEELFLSRVKGENIDSYAIFPTIANSNYEITYEKANLNIRKAIVTVRAKSQTKIYGEKDPVFDFEFEIGALSSWDTLEITREPGEDIGIYKIFATLDSTNYELTYIGANLEITKSIITVEAKSQVKRYGSPDPKFTYQVTSGLFVEGDVFEGELIREDGEALGEYPIYSTLSHPNYLITYISSNLTITVGELIIELDHLTKGFGTVDPEFTYRITSGEFDDSTDLSKLIKRDTGEAVGVYNITMEYSNDNYFITIVDGSLTIEKNVPVVSTMEAADVSGNAANFEGKLISNGGNEVIEQGFILGNVNSNLVAKNSSSLVRIELDARVPFKSAKDNLNSETTYYYRAYAVNSMGIGYGEIRSFTTLDITAPNPPTVLQAATFTCPDNREVTSDNNFIIVGIAEPETVVEIFMNGISMGYANTNIAGEWSLDMSEITQEDGNYEFTATATDLSMNTSAMSDIYSILISTVNSDLDDIPDHCDDDDENDGYLDANQIQEKVGYGISPNGDGINDVLVIRDIENYPNNQLTIYSRSGALVYKANAYDNTWDGRNMFTSGEAKLPEGSYFFVLDLKATGKHIVQGWIYITY